MASIKFATAVRSAMAQAIVDALDGGAGPGLLQFYTGAQPASPDVAVTTQILLGTLTLSDPAGTITTGVLTFDVITQDGAADANGDATWARLRDSTGSAIIDLDVSDTSGAGAIKLNTIHIVAGGPILMNSLVITIGA